MVTSISDKMNSAEIEKSFSTPTVHKEEFSPGVAKRYVNGLIKQTMEDAKIIHAQEEGQEVQQFQFANRDEAVYDQDGSRKLGKQEVTKFLGTIMKEITDSTPSDSEIEKNFETMNSDNSGYIDQEEVLKFLKGFQAGYQSSQTQNQAKGK